jgi:hypothetical protein
MSWRVKAVNLLRKSVTLLLLISLLSMPFWFSLTEPYVVKPSPLKLYEIIHPTYYVGLATLILSIIILSVRAKENFHSTLNLYLLTAMLATFYLQLTPVALFEHPISDHILHLVPTFYILREGNIYMPSYPHPETVTPQLFASILVMVASLPSPLENLHRISLFILPLLTTLYIYIFMKKLSTDERFAMMASMLNMGLTHVLFMFLRQTYAMSLYVMLVFLVFIALNEGQSSHFILAIVTMLTFIMSDPAHVLLTIIPLMFFAVAWKGLSLLGKVNYHHFRSPCIFVLLMAVTFLSWIINRYERLFINLWSIVETMWDVFIRSISELALPIQESRAYWGRPTVLVYNGYYMFLYRVRIALIVISIILPAILLAYMFLSRKTRSVIFRFETMYLNFFFVVTVIPLILKSYGFTYTPWTVMTMFYVLNYFNNVKQGYKVHQILKLFVILFLLTSIIVAPCIICSGERVRLPTRDMYALLWLGKNPPQTSMTSPGYGGWLSEYIYILMGQHVRIADYLFYEGLTLGTLDKLAESNIVIVPESTLMHFEKTEACYIAPEMFKLLTSKLSSNHNLVYSSGNLFFTVWIAVED